MPDTCEGWHQLEEGIKDRSEPTYCKLLIAQQRFECVCVARVGSPILALKRPNLLAKRARGLFVRFVSDDLSYIMRGLPTGLLLCFCFLYFGRRKTVAFPNYKNTLIKPCQAGRSLWILYGYARERPRATSSRDNGGRGAAWWRGSAGWITNTTIQDGRMWYHIWSRVRRLPHWRCLSTGASNSTHTCFSV